MKTIASPSLGRTLTAVAAVSLLTACVDQPLAPTRQAAPSVQSAALTTLQRATTQYHDLAVAKADGFVLLDTCGTSAVYVHVGRLLDGKLDAASPDALVYESRATGRATLVAAELAVPYALWRSSTSPRFAGAELARHDAFGMWTLRTSLSSTGPSC